MTTICLTGVSSMSKRQTSQSLVKDTENSWQDVAKNALCTHDGNTTAVIDALFAYNPENNWFVSIIR